MVKHYAITVLFALASSLFICFASVHLFGNSTPLLGGAIGAAVSIGLVSSFLVRRTVRSLLFARLLVMVGAALGCLIGLCIYAGLTS